MAYTNAIFYMNHSTGSDAARTALTSCTASNPSGTITRINKTGHGLVTGAIVDLTLFSTWLNDAWKITVVDADNFDLDGAVWQATADTSGTVTPRGGSSWSDAWQTPTNGATVGRTQPGDTIRIAKTADPVSLGQNATFTSGSATVTLTSAVTKKIEDATANDWTVSANITGGTNASRKLGSNALTLTPAAGFTTGKVAYKAIAGGGTQDFSGYTKISFWFRPTTAAAIADATYKICLCSDATGDTIVNEINIPATLASTNWQCMTLDYGGALSASVQSVAIYANSDPGTTALSINNIFAANDLHLKSVIGPQNDTNYRIQSIDGTTIKLDQANNTTASGRGYYGTGGTVTCYYSSDHIYTNSTGSAYNINESGSSTGGYITYSGGWNTSSNLRDGYTSYFDLTMNGADMYSTFKGFLIFEYFKYFGHDSMVGSLTTNTGGNIYRNLVFNCTASGVVGSTLQGANLIENCLMLNAGTSFNIGPGHVRDCNIYSSSSTGFTVGVGTFYINCVTANNTSPSVSNPGATGSVLSLLGSPNRGLRNCSLLDASEVNSGSGVAFSDILWSFDHDQTDGNHWGFFTSGTINWQTVEKQGSDPGAWKVSITAASAGQHLPARLKIAEVACTANSLVTFKVWIKKDHATNIAAKVIVFDEDYNLDGISETSSTKASDTNWEELTITFTPTKAGIVPIFVDSWYVAAASNVYIGSITVTQA